MNAAKATNDFADRLPSCKSTHNDEEYRLVHILCDIWDNPKILVSQVLVCIHLEYYSSLLLVPGAFVSATWSHCPTVEYILNEKNNSNLSNSISGGNKIRINQ
jgi:hypothetical protein